MKALDRRVGGQRRERGQIFLKKKKDQSSTLPKVLETDIGSPESQVQENTTFEGIAIAASQHTKATQSWYAYMRVCVCLYVCVHNTARLK